MLWIKVGFIGVILVSKRQQLIDGQVTHACSEILGKQNKTVIRWKNVNKLNSKDMKLLKYKHQALHIRKENTDKYWTIFRE